jgi:hypothetical protein
MSEDVTMGVSTLRGGRLEIICNLFSLLGGIKVGIKMGSQVR